MTHNSAGSVMLLSSAFAVVVAVSRVWLRTCTASRASSVASNTLDVVFVGLGKMGHGMATRIQSLQQQQRRDSSSSLSSSASASPPTIRHLIVWNRSSGRCDDLVLAGARTAATVADCMRLLPGHSEDAAADKVAAADAVVTTLVIAFLSNYAQTRDVLFNDAATRALLSSPSTVLLCCCSGTPDDAKSFAAAARTACPSLGAYVDGCYAGSPTKAKHGTGLLLLSCDGRGAGDAFAAAAAASADDDSVDGVAERRATTTMDLWRVRVCHRLFRRLGARAAFTGAVGTGKAIDYGVVDAFLLQFVSLLSALSYAEAEGVTDFELLLSLMHERSVATTDVFRALLASPNMQRREYDANVIASIDTWTSFLGDRRAYMAAHNLNTEWVTWASSLFAQVTTLPSSSSSSSSASAPASSLGQHCFLRLQELLRYNNCAGGDNGGRD